MSIILRENENKIKEVRQHGIFLIPAIIVWVVCSAGAVYVNGKFFAVVAVLGALLVARRIIVWRRTVLTLTNERVICEVRHGLFSAMVIEILVADILEISYERQGIIAALFRYGDLILKTASDTTHVFERIPHPEVIVNDLHTLRV